MSETISFSFGENWLNYIKNIGEQRFEEAQSSLKKLLKINNLNGKSFLDIGCGSGIMSLSAIKLGAKEVVSIDVDPKSVEASQLLKEKCDVSHWQILNDSILNETFISHLKQYDIVYSWGVLHHTGNMWTAIKNASTLVKKDGIFCIAIYNKTWSSAFWLWFKKLYNKSNSFIKKLLVLYIMIPRMIIRLLKLKHPLKDKRGMSVYYDAIDWAGGYPYEYASFDEINQFVGNLGFKLINSSITKQIGCNEFVFVKN